MGLRRRRRRTLATRLANVRTRRAVTAVLVLAAAVYAVAVGAGRAVDQAEQLRLAELAVAGVETSRAHLSQTLILAVDLADDRATEAAFETSLDQARRTLTETRSAVLEVMPPGPEQAVADAGLQRVFAMLDLLEEGDLTQAKRLAETSVAGSLETLTERLSTIAAAEAADVRRTLGWAGLTTHLARFAVALVFPGALILGYWALGRRQVRTEKERAGERAKQAILEAQLHVEREINTAKDEFIANVSHELRTPLTAISGFAEVLEEGMIHDPETGLELVNLIIGQASELSRMVEDLLTASRADSGTLTFKLEDVDIRDEVEKVVPSFERLGSTISVSCPSVTVYADPLRVRQILRNLIANACTHGGSNIDISGVRAGSVLTLWVADDGPGVPDHVKDRLFERYVHRGELPLLIGSVGLGLAIARVLAREMGGDIRYERADGHTYFMVELPVSASEDRAAVDEVGSSDLDPRSMTDA